MFENLSEKFQGVLKKLRGHGRISEGNIEEALREVRLALLEADVNYKVVKDFTAAVREKALGAELIASLYPAPHFIIIVPARASRQAALDQLKVLGAQIGIPVSDSPPSAVPVEICRLAVRQADLA